MRRKVHRAFIEERHDKDTASDSNPMPGRVWIVARCFTSGLSGYGRVEKDGVADRPVEAGIHYAVFWLDGHCGAEHVL